ncbi:MAG: hypothetical protein LBP56_10485 [Odoribacteraceae bacterium]|jgi:hypothetical protein|nr:hypothetical protein [Odoribacteraceae bacterium]
MAVDKKISFSMMGVSKTIPSGGHVAGDSPEYEEKRQKRLGAAAPGRIRYKKLT